MWYLDDKLDYYDDEVVDVEVEVEGDVEVHSEKEFDLFLLGSP